jgi:hypothetical protein
MIALIEKYNIKVLAASDETDNLARRYIAEGILPETSVSEQLPYKNVVLQGFSPKNYKTCETTDRVVEQV